VGSGSHCQAVWILFCAYTKEHRTSTISLSASFTPAMMDLHFCHVPVEKVVFYVSASPGATVIPLAFRRRQSQGFKTWIKTFPPRFVLMSLGKSWSAGLQAEYKSRKMMTKPAQPFYFVPNHFPTPGITFLNTERFYSWEWCLVETSWRPLFGVARETQPQIQVYTMPMRF